MQGEESGRPVVSSNVTQWFERNNCASQPASVAGALVEELKADGQDKGQHPFEEHLAIVQQVRVSRFIVEIDGDGAVMPRLCGCFGQGVTPKSSGLVS